MEYRKKNDAAAAAAAAAEPLRICQRLFRFIVNKFSSLYKNDAEDVPLMEVPVESPERKVKKSVTIKDEPRGASKKINGGDEMKKHERKISKAFSDINQKAHMFIKKVRSGQKDSSDPPEESTAAAK
ncbi:hypothetical protein Cni_G13250 [Canna indica]|uniref:Uncharacterized protein n=1 Tax=Canna indica TaxID=4628 RepID=A0AAQ3QBC2_9LILI|nr:hypothetical protein Cni_G13250 [Canna indica]